MKEQYSLPRSFMMIKNDKLYAYGGDQNWFTKKSMRGAGCGLAAAANVVAFMESELDNNQKIDVSAYLKIVDGLKKYLPIIPFFGINGWMLAIGMNIYFKKNELPFFASWGTMPRHLWKRMGHMLENGIPVILSIGPNFPDFFAKHELNLYEKSLGNYVSKCRVKGHYLTVTALDEKWMTVSSWGKKYYINRDEYDLYVRRYSNNLFSNILVIR